jgi:hypothetical protein
MRLPDFGPDVFGFVVEWIYKSDFDLGSVSTAAKLWHLADRFLMPALQNKAMDAIVEKCNEFSDDGLPAVEEGIQCINLIYEAKGEKMLKKVMTDKFAFSLSSNLLEEWRPFLPQEMTADIMMAYSRHCHGLRKLRNFNGKTEAFKLIPRDYYVAVETSGVKKSCN